ncbi:MAG: DUF3574 domain-containing protein [Flavobacterium sp.]|nr:DUF3574 domain-containing protein [Flavobacterium sp.]
MNLQLRLYTYLIGKKSFSKTSIVNLKNKLQKVTTCGFSFTLFFSDTDSAAKRIDDRSYETFLDKVRFNIVDSYNGLTERKATGYFKGQSGTMSETITIFDVYAFESADTSKVDNILKLLSDYSKHFDQECILLLFNDKAFMLYF